MTRWLRSTRRLQSRPERHSTIRSIHSRWSPLTPAAVFRCAVVEILSKTFMTPDRQGRGIASICRFPLDGRGQVAGEMAEANRRIGLPGFVAHTGTREQDGIQEWSAISHLLFAHSVGFPAIRSRQSNRSVGGRELPRVGPIGKPLTGSSTPAVSHCPSGTSGIFRIHGLF
jgi:hypothetical protein